jgi:mannitol 2-dehydrogenase
VASAMNLNNAALTRLPIPAPNYDRGNIGVGIAHIGAGHFQPA